MEKILNFLNSLFFLWIISIGFGLATYFDPRRYKTPGKSWKNKIQGSASLFSSTHPLNPTSGTLRENLVL